MGFNIVCPDWFFTSMCNLQCKYCFEEHQNKCITYDKAREFIENKCFIDFFPFGGEPLMNIDLLCEMLDNTIGKRKDRMREIITNGTLITQNIEKIKKYGLRLQISIDGPKHVNDMNRVFKNGKGTYDKIMEGIECCIENNIPWSIHGVINKETLPFLSEIYIWFYKTYRKGFEIDHIINHMKENITIIIFEEDYTDKDIDILLEQIEKLFEEIHNIEELTNEQKKWFILNTIEHTGAKCGAGTNLLAIDDKLDIYPCHRLATVKDKEKYKLGNVYDVENMKNFELYNAFIRLSKKNSVYSVKKNIDGFKDKENLRFMNWCPSTNLETSNSVFYQNAKYNIMMVELNRKIKELLNKYGYTVQSNNRK